MTIISVWFPSYPQSLARKYGIQGFPTILVFAKDKENPTKYEGERTASAIEQYALATMDEMAPPPDAVEVTGEVRLTTGMMQE